MLKAVKDWVWFWFVIKGDKFHPSLYIDMRAICSGQRGWEEELDRVERLRERANRLDLKYKHRG